jgi:hypothetical protein
MSSPESLPPEPPITYEEAEYIFESTRPATLKAIETDKQRLQRRELTFAFISLQLLEEGLTLPVSVSHADSFEEVTPVVVKTLSDWRKYWISADEKRLGISLQK